APPAADSLPPLSPAPAGLLHRPLEAEDLGAAVEIQILVYQFVADHAVQGGHEARLLGHELVGARHQRGAGGTQFQSALGEDAGRSEVRVAPGAAVDHALA